MTWASIRSSDCDGSESDSRDIYKSNSRYSSDSREISNSDSDSIVAV